MVRVASTRVQFYLSTPPLCCGVRATDVPEYDVYDLKLTREEDGLWYPKDSPFDLVAYTDSDYAGASLDRKSTTGGCQFLGSRLISWQCKKQTVVANSTTEAEYVAASSCCGQVLWIQNQLLDYGYNFMHTKIFIDNNSINLLLLLEVNAARNNLLLLLEVNTARHNLLLLLEVNAVRHKLTTAGGMDGKKIIITESIVRRDLQLEDAEGVDCLPNATIFEQLTLMGSKTTAWNEFSSTMASAIICLATNQKFNFSKYIFESMVKNLDNVSDFFLMYLRSKRSKRKDIEVPQPSGPTTNVADEAVNEEMYDSLERAATTTGLEAEQDSGSGPRCQEIIGDTIAQTRYENVSKLSNDPLLARGNTLRSGEDRLKLEELMELCITLQLRVLALETTKNTQAMEITSLKRRVKKLERRNNSRTHMLKRLYRVGSSRRMLTAEETRSVVEEVTAVTILVSAATTTTTTTAITDVEMTLAQVLAELKSAKPKANKVVIQEPKQGTTTPILTTTTDAIIITAVNTRLRAKGSYMEAGFLNNPSKDGFHGINAAEVNLSNHLKLILLALLTLVEALTVKLILLGFTAVWLLIENIQSFCWKVSGIRGMSFYLVEVNLKKKARCCFLVIRVPKRKQMVKSKYEQKRSKQEDHDAEWIRRSFVKLPIEVSAASWIQIGKCHYYCQFMKLPLPEVLSSYCC
ncbi:hypothetical protein Tco_0629989 [Tanacetum coccineum]|uniref:Uncharacterized protein n=1 Tax=Tanacetum coccineum TaxID=301880 RepID=A0ABQ4WUQ7_9ASTR